MRLTGKGEDYYKKIRRALNLIEAATESLTDDHQETTITIDIPPSLSVIWLPQHLSKMQAMWPDLTIQVYSTDQPIDKVGNEIDIAIKALPIQYLKDKNCEFLTTEHLSLIVDENHLKQQSGAKNLRLFSIKGRPDFWPTVIEDLDLGLLNNNGAVTSIVYEHYYMVLDAVKNGLGLGLVPDFLCENLIEKGELKCLSSEPIKSGYAYFLITPPHKTKTKKVQLFADYVKKEFRPLLSDVRKAP